MLSELYISRPASTCYTFVFLILLSTSAFCQRSYFEYNNPDAIRINKKIVDQLTAFEWDITDVRWLIRKDTFDFGGGVLTLHGNGTYSSSPTRTKGTWEIKYHRYLVLKDTSERVDRASFSGTFAITSITDSTLVLNQLYTSSRDMSRTLSLVKYEGAKHSREESYPERSTWTRPSNPQPAFSPVLLDSLSFLSDETLSLMDHRVMNDTLYITDAFAGYKVHLDRNNPMKKVKIFHEDEFVPDHEAYRRFTLAANQLPLVDSLAIKYIRKHRDDYAPQNEITSMASYFRQYVGYYDINGDAIVLINAFCQYKGDWRESLVQVGLGGVCYFNISVNLTKKVAFSFNVNDF